MISLEYLPTRYLRDFKIKKGPARLTASTGTQTSTDDLRLAPHGTNHFNPKNETWILSLRGPFKRRVLQSLSHPKPKCLKVGDFLLVPLKAPENLALLFPFSGSPVWYSTCTGIKQIGTFQLVDKDDQALPIVTVEEQHRPVFSGSVTSTSAKAIKAPLHQFVFIGHGETDRSMFYKSLFVQRASDLSRGREWCPPDCECDICRRTLGPR
ncbi:hypothetical protein HPB47_003100 [Ixodes persulcatus]|uniref:Uncharacterized protein n=1 Tax=Ixodes persulcatus TaxID=34615 RepID=A0AC60PJL9_IXOPE|nr:hypothetical protein HPB47_003100 [Ixodes persulcatus]